MPLTNETHQDHADFDRQLKEHEEQLKDFAKRLRVLEIEAGIYRLPPEGVSSDS